MNNPSGTQTSIQDFLTLPEVQSLLQELNAPEASIQSWLTSLALLKDVPFQNLVADTRLLPQESLRFFYLDPSWLNAMLDGALSIGNHTSLEVMFTNTMASVAKAAGAGVLIQLQHQLQGLQPDFPGDSNNPPTLLAGLMLRSQIVSDWPGLQVIPIYADSSLSTPPPLLRFEKIGADLLLIIFPVIPNGILIKQPAHTLAFGAEDGNAQAGYNIYLRGLGTGNFTSGAEMLNKAGESIPITFQATGTGFFRPGGNNVLDINNIHSSLQSALQTNGALGATDTLSPGGFAIQMVKTSEQVTFSNPNSAAVSTK